MTAISSSIGDGHRIARKLALRKGTHSCWECKRRKMKCVMADDKATVCVACHRRGSACITQEVPEDVAREIAHKRRQREASDGSSEEHAPTQHSSQSTRSKYMAFYRSRGDKGDNSTCSQPVTGTFGRNQKLSEFLHQSLPCAADMDLIRQSCPVPRLIHAYEVLTTPYTSLLADHLEKPDMLFEDPGPTAHPVLVARHMLLVASFLQHMDERTYPPFKALSEKTTIISERLADLAVNLVTTKDELLGSLEGLECIMLEAVYHANAGNVRRSWLAGRRAVSIGQLMGLNRNSSTSHFKTLNQTNKIDARVIWFRVVFMDRSLSLMLGLSQACTDYDMSAMALLEGDAPCNKMEQTHCAIAAQILERNQRPPAPEDMIMTRTLDVELQKAVRSLPTDWWLAPSPTDLVSVCVSTRRIFAQVLHFNLLNQLHLPFLLRSTWNGQDCSYSRMTCIHASREVVLRYITVRSFNNVATSCRLIDFLALMAAMTLILAHLDTDPTEPANLLAHSYPSDRAMIERVQKGMLIREKDRNVLSARSAELLGRLLSIEPGASQDSHAEDSVVSLHVPYFGIIEIAGNGVSLVETIGRAGTFQVGQRASQEQGPKHEASPPGMALPVTSSVDALLDSPNYIFDSDVYSQTYTPWSQDQPQPGHTTDTASWAFQGVDLAFFDNLTRTASS